MGPVLRLLTLHPVGKVDLKPDDCNVVRKEATERYVRCIRRPWRKKEERNGG